MKNKIYPELPEDVKQQIIMKKFQRIAIIVIACTVVVCGFMWKFMIQQEFHSKNQKAKQEVAEVVTTLPKGENDGRDIRN